MAALMGDLEVVNGYDLGIARERHTGAHALDFDDGTCTLNDFFATQGMSPLFQETEAHRCRDGSGAGNLFRDRPWLRRFERGPGASSLSCAPRKRMLRLLRPLVRPPALSRGRAWRVGTFGLGRLNARPFPRPAPKLLMQPSVQLPPSFAAGALFVHPIYAIPVARCAGAGDCLHLSGQADR
jgi:hypothetical protein